MSTAFGKNVKSGAKGKIYFCNGKDCDKFVFLQHIGDGVMDGGYTKWNKFEELPDGWTTYNVMESKKRAYLCPDCSAKLNGGIYRVEQECLSTDLFEN